VGTLSPHPISSTTTRGETEKDEDEAEDGGEGYIDDGEGRARGGRGAMGEDGEEGGSGAGVESGNSGDVAADTASSIFASQATYAASLCAKCFT